MSFDPLFALLVIVVLALPYLIWLIRADALVAAALAGDRRICAQGRCTGPHLLGGLLFGDVRHRDVGRAQFRLVRTQSRKRRRSSIGRRSIRLARDFVYFFAIGPALAGA